MYKNKYYAISLILALGVTFIIPIFVKNGITKVVFAQDKKEKTKEAQIDPQKKLIMERLKEGGNNAAIESAEAYLASNSKDIEVANLLTEVYINKNNLSAAKRIITKSLLVAPNNPWSCRLLARVYRETSSGQKDQSVKKEVLDLAMQQVNAGLASNPNDVQLLAEKAQVFLEQGDKAKANETIDKAIGINSNDPSLLAIERQINQNEKK